MTGKIVLLFAENGVVIGNRENHKGIDLSYAEMAEIVIKFTNMLYSQSIITDNYGTVKLKRIKEGNGSPYQLEVYSHEKSRKYQIKGSEIIGIEGYEKGNLEG